MIKYSMIAFLIVFLYSFRASAEEKKFNCIQIKLTKFLKDVEEWPWDVDSLASSLIIDKRIDKNILECEDGVFSIITISTSTYTHYIVIDRDSSFIINMRNPIEKNIELLLDYFKNNQKYTREDVIFYISDMITTNNKNHNKYFNHIKR